jgi:hypothetical protein
LFKLFEQKIKQNKKSLKLLHCKNHSSSTNSEASCHKRTFKWHWPLDSAKMPIWVEEMEVGKDFALNLQ